MNGPQSIVDETAFGYNVTRNSSLPENRKQYVTDIYGVETVEMHLEMTYQLHKKSPWV